MNKEFYCKLILDGDVKIVDTYKIENHQYVLLDNFTFLLQHVAKKLEEEHEHKQRIDKAIELLEKENYHCPMSLTVEKAYIIEVEKINNVISILRGDLHE